MLYSVQIIFFKLIKNVIFLYSKEKKEYLKANTAYRDCDTPATLVLTAAAVILTRELHLGCVEIKLLSEQFALVR